MSRAMDASDPPDRRFFLFFDYYVFESNGEQTGKQEAEGVYLVGKAEAEHLRQFFDPLSEKVGIVYIRALVKSSPDENG